MSQPVLSYEHIKLFTKDLPEWWDLGNRASPVNTAYVKRPLDTNWLRGEFHLEYIKTLRNERGVASIAYSKLT